MNAASPPPTVVYVRARGKLNLSLRVLRRRADGFHDILSWMQPIDWADELTVRTSRRAQLRCICRSGASTEIRTRHGSAGPAGRGMSDGKQALSGDKGNLAVRAALALARRVGRPPRVDIDLTKNLPVGGGLGGGSADAAAVLLALARLWKLPSGDPRIVEAAAQIGSDVPFFLSPGAAIARGRGTEIESHPRPFAGWAVLILPPFGVSTAAVYAACRQRALSRREVFPWRRPYQSASQLSSRLVNDLTPAAFAVEPRLAALHRALDGRDGVRVHMSGSGSTLFALFDDARSARAWAEESDSLGESGVQCRVVRVLTGRSCTIRQALRQIDRQRMRRWRVRL